MVMVVVVAEEEDFEPKECCLSISNPLLLRLQQ